MAELLRLANSEAAAIPPPAFVMTETARNIHRSLKMMEKLPGFRIGLICGTAGIGKTLALDAYLAGEPLAFRIAGAGGESEAKGLSEDLCFRFDIYGWENMSLTSRRNQLVCILESIKVLIIDEAQHYRRDVLIRLPLSEAEAAKFEGRWTMVTPLSEAEAMELRDKFNLVQDAVCKLALALSTLHEVLETRKAGEQDIRKLLAQWVEPSRAADGMLDRCRELPGRAVFVGGPENPEKMQ